MPNENSKYEQALAEWQRIDWSAQKMMVSFAKIMNFFSWIFQNLWYYNYETQWLYDFTLKCWPTIFVLLGKLKTS